MWVTTIWSIWDQMNNIIFRNVKVDVEEIFSLTQVKTWAWITINTQERLFHIRTGAYAQPRV